MSESREPAGAGKELVDFEAEVAGMHQLIVRQADLLRDTINVLRGEPPELTWWSHHDVAEHARRVVAERDQLHAAIERALHALAPDGATYGNAVEAFNILRGALRHCGCFPHGPDEPCTCTGCWACAGHVVGCTCDIAWDCEHRRSSSRC